MRESIKSILDELEALSALEKARKVDVAPQDRMLAITKETGEMLNIILRLKNAKNMLEVGTSVGYSTIWCAEAIAENAGKIITIEQNPAKIARASHNIERAGLASYITIMQGVAINILQELCTHETNKNHFDAVLLDADKENIIEYFELILPMVVPGGIIITDNMLYPIKYREEMKEFSNYLRKNHNLRTITSPIGNGEEITIKLV